MGAWGLSLFDSDYEADLISNLDAECGLRKLEEEAQAKARAAPPSKSKKAKKSGNEKNNDPADDIYYTMQGGGSDPARVRKFLNEGALQSLIDKYVAKWRGPKDKKDWYPADFVLVMIGASAMTVGCKLPPDFKVLLKRLYLHVNLMTTAVKQMAKALGPTGYKEGEPYDFPLDKPEPEPARIGAGMNLGYEMLNVHGKGTMFEPRVPAPQFPDSVCGGCGAKEGEGDDGGLLACGKCKKRKYCSRDCQKIHWAVHKKVCKAPEGGD